MSDRFYIAPGQWDAPRLTLADDEARHCTQVMRHRIGDEIVVGNGCGDVARARIAEIRKHEVLLDTLAIEHIPPPGTRITLAPALIKAEAWEWMIEKTTELGVAEIQPMVTERSVVRLGPDEETRKHDKWKRVIIEAAKQCRRAWLPELRPIRPLDEVVGRAAGFDLALIASTAAPATSIKEAVARFAQRHCRRPSSAVMLIGPEGDFTPAEIELASHHQILPVSLGLLTLRAETAALAAVAILSSELQ